MADGDGIRGIFIIIFVIQAVLFSFFYIIGIFIILGLFFYFMFFVRVDKKMKKEELKEILCPREYRRMHNIEPPKEFP